MPSVRVRGLLVFLSPVQPACNTLLTDTQRQEGRSRPRHSPVGRGSGQGHCGAAQGIHAHWLFHSQTSLTPPPGPGPLGAGGVAETLQMPGWIEGARAPARSLSAAPLGPLGALQPGEGLPGPADASGRSAAQGSPGPLGGANLWARGGHGGGVRPLPLLGRGDLWWKRKPPSQGAQRLEGATC